MSVDTELGWYAALLEIRHQAARRDAAITRWVSVFSVLSFYAFGPLGYLEGRSLYVAAPLLVAFGAGYVIAQSRLDVTASLLELAGALRNREL